MCLRHPTFQHPSLVACPADAGGSCWFFKAALRGRGEQISVQGQLGLHSKSQGRQEYIVRPCVNNKIIMYIHHSVLACFLASGRVELLHSAAVGLSDAGVGATSLLERLSYVTSAAAARHPEPGASCSLLQPLLAAP